MKIDKREKDYSIIFPIIFIAACFIIVFIAFYPIFSYRDIKITDLTQIRGTIEEFYPTGYKNFDLAIRLKEYPEIFYVSSIEMRILNDNKFKLKEFRGGSINISILKDDYKTLGSNSNHQNKTILIYAISNNEQEYFNVDDFNKFEKSDAKAGVWLGVLFTLIGTITLFFFIKIMMVKV